MIRKRYPVTDARKNISDILDDVHFRNAVVFVTRQERDIAVIVSVDEFHRLEESKRELARMQKQGTTPKLVEGRKPAFEPEEAHASEHEEEDEQEAPARTGTRLIGRPEDRAEPKRGRRHG